MTEHCINNGSSICQTKDATHLILSFDLFSADTTVGFTYSGKQAELMLLLNSDPEAAENRLTLSVTNISDSLWHVALYDDPYDITSKAKLKSLPMKEKLLLYPIREYEFGKCDELIVFIKFGDENLLLLEQDIEPEEMYRLWKCLDFLYSDSVFADMTVENSHGQNIPAHRAILAAASHVLDDTVSSLELITDHNTSEENYCHEEINKTNRVASMVVVVKQFNDHNYSRDDGKEKFGIIDSDNDTSRKQLDAEYTPPSKKKKTDIIEAEIITKSLISECATHVASTSQEKCKKYNANQILTHHPSLAKTSSTVENKYEDDNNEKEEMLLQFSTFLAEQNKSQLPTSDLSSAKNIHKVVQEFLTQHSTSALEENNDKETFVKPNPRNYLLAMNGFKSETPLQEYLCYIYTGQISIDIGT